ncbi:DNA-binding transcriptional LysR family regulator [Halomonas campaniensis]|uniref:DNA-binding transcriptional LysR family regulator n=1 Tax=Halomonas campaniensis TaxID=213554 RepID=A0A7W5K3G7_9GAMM|nr:LysR family transcriptional regulator [Halomonas campaniensis]MBB3331259.1 DNA-binding transcriptional LysR family regulator [Halomonas campaniensis]
MHDLNDYFYFHAVVTHRGFSAASRHIGVPKGTLSKRVTRLEERLQLRLLERSTRKVRPTEVGQAFYEHCETMLAGVEAAETVAAQAQAEPNGIVRLSCPQGLIHNLIRDILPAFMKRYPRVRVHMQVFERRADLIEDRLDIAIRVRTRPDMADASLVMRPLGQSQLVLAASPAMQAEHELPTTIDQLTEVPALSMAEESDMAHWELHGPDDETRIFDLRPRLMCSNFDMLLAAAREGLGVALLPNNICQPGLDSGELIRVLPEWRTPYGTIQAVFASRRGLVPAVRALIDFLAEAIPCKLSMNEQSAAG